MQELDYIGIGERIRKERKARGMSQTELAKKCGICLSFMGHIERGTRRMSLETFANICKILDLDADKLLWNEEHQPDSVRNMWNLSDSKAKKRSGKATADSYAMYVRIMKSVAEIMNSE